MTWATLRCKDSDSPMRITNTKFPLCKKQDSMLLTWDSCLRRGAHQDGWRQTTARQEVHRGVHAPSLLLCRYQMNVENHQLALHQSTRQYSILLRRFRFRNMFSTGCKVIREIRHFRYEGVTFRHKVTHFRYNVPRRGKVQFPKGLSWIFGVTLLPVAKWDSPTECNIFSCDVTAGKQKQGF